MTGQTDRSLTEGERAYAATMLLRHTVELANRVDHLRKNFGPEHVHRTRVAARRLRNALRLFADHLPRRRVLKWTKAIKKLQRSLGSLRDLDVQASIVGERLNLLSPQAEPRLCAERMLLRLGQQRPPLADDARTAVQRFDDSGALLRMRKILRGWRLGKRLSPRLKEHLAAHARHCVTQALERVLGFEEHFRDPQRIRELHQTRIAVKHLRYTMEDYGPLYEDRLRRPIALVRKIQTVLGAIHDADVWAERMHTFINEERKRHRAFFGTLRGFSPIERGLEACIHDIQQRRREAYHRFLELWRERATGRCWTKLTVRKGIRRSIAHGSERQGRAA